MVKYEAAIKEVDVRLAVGGGDVGKGPKQQKTEITIYTLRNGVVYPGCHMHGDTESGCNLHASSVMHLAPAPLLAPQAVTYYMARLPC